MANMNFFLTTDRLVLRSWLHSDAPALATLANNAVVARYLRDHFPSPYTLADATKYIKSCLSPDTTTLSLAIFLRADDGAEGADGAAAAVAGANLTFIGSIGLIPKTGNYRHTRELGYWVGEQFWGRGYATEAIRAIVDWAFCEGEQEGDGGPVQRVEAEVVVGNGASIRVVEKTGFVLEGRRRSSKVKRGQLMDDLIYSVIRADWVKR